MLGLGESWEQIIETLEDLKQNCVDFITIGQYLAPSEKHAAVEKYYSSIEFEKLKKIADNMGFKGVASGKLVRSSYHAEEMASNWRHWRQRSKTDGYRWDYSKSKSEKSSAKHP